ncbi:hypothetical protein RND61_03405 [Streptomyces sp. TRM76323]|uniref:Integral membrane protein n=1 Tax=Streptomyces tamarix TaxID=3078565 RepID=A0ABU3QFG0_9ACTN|nr:hypothetical protein [Streptomyces tamarix]MDT9681127.1 hypothetical protein [Streptomyces tamarix]
MSFGGQNPHGGDPYAGHPYGGDPYGNPYVPGPRPPYQQPYPYPYPHQHPYQSPHPYPYRPPLWQRFREDEWPTLRELLGYMSGGRALLWVPFVCCVWPALAILVGYPMARAARRKARQVFPYDARRIGDPDIARVQKARAWAAAVASLLILAVYGTAEDWDQAQDQYLMRLALTPWLLLLSTPVVVLVLFRLSPPVARPGMRAGLRPAVRSVLWYFGALTATPLLAWGSVLVSSAMRGRVPDPVAALMGLSVLVVMAGTGLFLVFSSGRAVRSAFNTTEVHAALPALLTGVLVWEMAAVNLAYGGPPPGPPLVQVCALLGGPASVSAVAWWEMRQLRLRYGVTVRG